MSTVAPAVLGFAPFRLTNPQVIRSIANGSVDLLIRCQRTAFTVNEAADPRGTGVAV